MNIQPNYYYQTFCVIHSLEDIGKFFFITKGGWTVRHIPEESWTGSDNEIDHDFDQQASWQLVLYDQKWPLNMWYASRLLIN